MDKFLYKLKQAKIYSACLKSLKDTSHDEAKQQYMCFSQTPVHDFDCMTKTKYPRDTPASFDALLVIEKIKNTLYGIEFKNQSAKDIDSSTIQKKFSDSQKTLEAIFTDINVATTDYIFIFCVIYKLPKDKNNKYDRWKPHISATTNKFDLESKIQNCFKKTKIITNDIEFFSKELKKLK